ncbi:PHB depolymerase family esterase [Dyella sp. C9]|uniref:PHB depolymerase family esterase n=1 Tax=Dyella sp. C9 TaxID=2202154 RepID=UPI000DF0040C|nr:PHB depolymerase family esterase [Dyella sp. C9]
MGRHCRRLACAWLLSWAAAGPAADAPTGLHDNVVFDAYSPLSGSSELARRLVSPLNARRLQQQAAATGATIQEQPVDLARERFALYVPGRMPDHGYALLVFVPPWNEARVPPAWIDVLERQGVILVTPANAGNDANVLDRREPLALLAASNVMALYRVDPRRVYVGGFSGGSRVALRLALGYPDLFHGALLDAGSDAIGVQIPLPPRELLEQFQTTTRVVYLTGQQDTYHQDTDRQSRQSLKDACVTDIDVESMAWTGHDLASPASLQRALASLDEHHAGEPATLAACRQHLDGELSAQLDQVQALIQRGSDDEARQRLQQIDTRFGGLAAPRSLTLATRLGGP